jgi:hypothetical protein
MIILKIKEAYIIQKQNLIASFCSNAVMESLAHCHIERYAFMHEDYCWSPGIAHEPSQELLGAAKDELPGTCHFGSWRGSGGGIKAF